MTAETKAARRPSNNVRVPRSQRRGLRRKKDREELRGSHSSIQRNDSDRSLGSITSLQSAASKVSTDSQHRRQRSNGSMDLSVLLRNGSNVVPDVAEPGGQASSRSLRSVGRQGTNESNASGMGSVSGRSGTSHARCDSNNSLSNLLQRGSIVVPRTEEPSSNLNAGLRRNVSDLSLHSLAAKNEGQSASLPGKDYGYNLDSSDESPAGGPALTRRDTIESREEDEAQNVGLTFDLDGVQEEEDDDAAPGSALLSLEHMAAEANAVTMDSSCWSLSENGTDNNSNAKRMEMEVSPGVYLPFRDAKQTWRAVAKGCTIRCCCLECGIELVAIQDCECVVCPDCHQLSPVFERPAGLTTAPHGIGLGLKPEVVEQKMAMQRRR